MLRQGLTRRNLLVEIDDNVLELLLEQGFNMAYGARPLKRAVERLVVLPLARYLATRGRIDTDLLRLERRGSEAVSYTHLDVYKRQLQRCSATGLRTDVLLGCLTAWAFTDPLNDGHGRKHQRRRSPDVERCCSW